MVQDSKHASRGNSFEIENLIKVLHYITITITLYNYVYTIHF